MAWTCILIESCGYRYRFLRPMGMVWVLCRRRAPLNGARRAEQGSEVLCGGLRERFRANFAVFWPAVLNVAARLRGICALSGALDVSRRALSGGPSKRRF
ncbi:MAG: hypothetical protein ABJL99_05170 [Aliishimia sp.]